MAMISATGACSTMLPACSTETSVADFRDHAEIVRHEQECRAVLALQVTDEAKDLLLHGHVAALSLVRRPRSVVPRWRTR